MLRRLAALTALLWVGPIESAHAQVAGRGYPSLARRPVESRDRDAEIAKAIAEQPAATPLGGDVQSELARLAKQASAAGQAFDRDYAASDRAVTAAGNAPAASENWVVAQEAISALDAGRYDSITALASMDSIYVAQLNAGADTGAIDSLRAPVAAMVDRQNDRLDSLRFRLAKP